MKNIKKWVDVFTGLFIMVGVIFIFVNMHTEIIMQQRDYHELELEYHEYRADIIEMYWEDMMYMQQDAYEAIIELKDEMIEQLRG